MINKEKPEDHGGVPKEFHALVEKEGKRKMVPVEPLTEGATVDAGQLYVSPLKRHWRAVCHEAKSKNMPLQILWILDPYIDVKGSGGKGQNGEGKEKEEEKEKEKEEPKPPNGAPPEPETPKTCEEPVFFTHLVVPLNLLFKTVLLHFFFRNGTKIEEGEYNSGKKAAEEAKKCPITHTEIIPTDLGNVKVMVDLFYAADPCCPCFIGKLTLDLGFIPRQERDINTGGECDIQCCNVDEEFEIEKFEVAGFDIEGTISIKGDTFKP